MQGEPIRCGHCGLEFRNGSQYVRVGPNRDVYYCRNDAECDRRREEAQERARREADEQAFQRHAETVKRMLGVTQALKADLSQIPGVRVE